MASILSLDTSNKFCSVSISKNGKLIHFSKSDKVLSHAEIISKLIQESLVASKHKIQDLDALALSQGPGSYTGLRIGASIAQGICYASKIPLIAINTLKIMVFGILESNKLDKNENLVFCPMLDARRMEVYTACYNQQLEQLKPLEAIVLNANYLKNFSSQKVVFFGDGVQKFKDICPANNNIFIDDNFLSAKNMPFLAFKAYKNQHFEDIAYFNPLYLKEFYTKKNK